MSKLLVLLITDMYGTHDGNDSEWHLRFETANGPGTDIVELHDWHVHHDGITHPTHLPLPMEMQRLGDAWVAVDRNVVVSFEWQIDPETGNWIPLATLAGDGDWEGAQPASPFEVTLGLVGDSNNDTQLDFGDLSGFAAGLDGRHDPACDINGDDACNFGDVSPFVGLLRERSISLVPELSTAALALVFGLSIWLFVRRP